ncbi:MAG: hypothetical protein JRJ00_00700 [Deltaproteobacteria bacterium]|nr:hypothetical protein [Deltaproteobacteria bacterium]
MKKKPVKQIQARGRAAAIDVVLDETTLDFRNTIKDIYDTYLLHEISDSVLLRRAIHVLFAITLKKIRTIQRMKDPVEKKARMEKFIRSETELLKFAACRFDFENPRELTDADIEKACKSVGIDING